MTKPKGAEKDAPRPICPSCKMRIRLPLAEDARDYNYISIDRYQIKELRNAAHTFDILSQKLAPGDCFSAVDFIEWCLPDTEPRKAKEKIALVKQLV
jgi:hypothetical protein